MQNKNHLSNVVKLASKITGEPYLFHIFGQQIIVNGKQNPS